MICYLRAGQNNTKQYKQLNQRVMAMKFTGSICLSDLPKRLVKNVDGKLYLNISVHENKEPLIKDGKVVSDHFISCAPKKEKRIEGEQYIIGNLRTWETPTDKVPSYADVNNAPSVGDDTRLPWEEDSRVF